MGTSDKIERLAQALAKCWRDGGTIDLPAQRDAPATRAEAYAVQDQIAALLREKIVGWKVGAAIEAVQRFEGHDGPIPGRLFASRLYHSPATIPGRRFGTGHKVECEFGFRVVCDLPATGPKQTRQSILEALVFHPAIEIAGSRYTPGTGGRPPRTFDTIADNGGGGAFVFGPAIKDWKEIEFDRLRDRRDVGIQSRLVGPDGRHPAQDDRERTAGESDEPGTHVLLLRRVGTAARRDRVTRCTAV